MEAKLTKNTKTKKWYTLGAAALLSVSMLAACNDEGDTDVDVNNPPADTDVDVTPPADVDVNIDDDSSKDGE